MLCKTEIFVSFAKGQAFPAYCCGFAGVRWPEGCTGKISPCCLGEMGSAGGRQLPQDRGGWGKAFSLC